MPEKPSQILPAQQYAKSSIFEAHRVGIGSLLGEMCLELYQINNFQNVVRNIC